MDLFSKIKRNILFVMCMMFFGMFAVAKISTAENSTNLQQAKNSIVRLETGYIENNSTNEKFHCVKNCCGCLISNFEGNVYIIAPYHDMKISDKERKKFLKKSKLKKDKVTLARKVVISGDIKSSVEIVATSEQQDFCLLNVEDILKEKDSLRFGELSDVESGDSASALGFVNGIKTKMQYDASDVEITVGEIQDISANVDNTKYIQHTAKISERNSGGALVDKDGYFIGMNNSSKEKNKVYYSLSIELIKELLDNRGIYYYSKDKDIALEELEKDIEESNKLVKASGYKKNTQEEFKNVVNEIQKEVASNQCFQVKQIDDLKQRLDDAKKKVVKKTSKIFVLKIVFGIADIVFVSIVIIMLLKYVGNNKRLKNAVNNKEIDGSLEKGISDNTMDDNISDNRVEKKIEKIGSTVILSEYTNQKVKETTSTKDNNFESRQYDAYLRKRNSDSYILVNKTSFIIGKNEDAVNYCIKGNASISRVHATIQWQNGNYYIYDMNSVNGTFVNDMKVLDKPVKIKHGDTVVLANEIFDFIFVKRKIKNG